MDNQFERDKACYEQHSESFRNLNNQMWQVPIIAMTLTGGLWFGIYSSEITSNTAMLILMFCGFCNFLLILILWRVRTIMGLLIEKLYKFNPDYAIDTKTASWPWNINNLVVILFSAMLALSSAISFFAAMLRYWPLICQM
ncbi:MAG: hypothetical protein K6L73_06415 [Cellvibrionaceae bacterium]